jgi:hypothetical protein
VPTFADTHLIRKRDATSSESILTFNAKCFLILESHATLLAYTIHLELPGALILGFSVPLFEHGGSTLSATKLHDINFVRVYCIMFLLKVVMGLVSSACQQAWFRLLYLCTETTPSPRKMSRRRRRQGRRERQGLYITVTRRALMTFECQQ